MGADYTLWNIDDKKKIKLPYGDWNYILNIESCILGILNTNKEYMISQLEHYEYSHKEAEIITEQIINFCGTHCVVLTSDCGKEYFDEKDVYEGIKDTFKEVKLFI